MNRLGASYRLRFDHLKNRFDIDRAIDYQIRAVLRTSDNDPVKVDRLLDLGTSYMRRSSMFYGPEDAESAATCFEKAVKSEIGRPRARFMAAREWSRSLLSLGISPGVAYRTAMEVLPQLLWHGSTISRRYQLLTKAGDITTKAVAWAISVKDYSCALEWLEAGRFMIWNQILQLQTPLKGLSAINPRLANRLMDIGKDLQEAISQPIVSQSSLQFQSSAHERWKLEEMIQHRHRLSNEWGQLLVEARNLDFAGAENWRCPRRASELVQAATDGPVIVINAHLDRCDALIVHPDLPTVTHIPLTLCVEKIKDVLDSRAVLLQVPPEYHPSVGHEKLNPAANIYEGGNLAVAMRKALETLWFTVVKPVLDSLGYTPNPNIEDLPHVTWCTTGFLSTLPLHAAGCYGSTSGPKAMDYVISSYTPTLGSLLPSPLPKSNGGILGVRPTYQDGKSYGFLDGAVHELEFIKGLSLQVAISYQQLDEKSATIETVLKAMDDCECVHMACHSTRGAGDPGEGAFHLFDGALTLSRLTRRSTTSKFLAFLSGCYTATGDEKLPDEELHFAAGMLVAGYQSVIATIGVIFDEEAPEVVRRVYAELLKEGQMDHTGAARALHKAVVALRNEIGDDTVDRWAAFVHIGV